MGDAIHIKEMAMRTFTAVMQDGHGVAHDFAWIKRALQGAIELEFFTIPPYLCAWFSLASDSQSGWVRSTVQDIVYEEMEHLALICSILRSIGGQPDLIAAVPQYPHPLPANVNSTFQVCLQGLNTQSVKTFVEIERPENEVPIGFAAEALENAESFMTIGEFYRAVKAAFVAVNATSPISFLNAGTLPTSANFPPTSTGVTDDMALIDSVTKATNAIDLIIDQGEGSSQSPTEDGVPSSNVVEPAHFYRFREIQQGMQIAKQPDGSWKFDPSKPVTFSVISVPPVPESGFSYAEYASAAGETGTTTLELADQAFTAIVDGMHDAWSAASADQADAALSAVAFGTMSTLANYARKIMGVQLPGSNPAMFYCPQFRYQ
jgi:hypothetical protein